MKTILVILTLLTHSLHIAAISLEKQAGNSPCESRTGTQTEANACARHKYKRADAGMNQVYEQLMTELAGFASDCKTQHKLRQAQSIWLQYRVPTARVRLPFTRADRSALQFTTHA